MDIHAEIDSLFDAAKSADEFEFCCTILRVRGIEGPGWDPLQESIAFNDQLLALIQAPVEDSLRLRLILMLYCHVTEMNDLYNILGNLIRIACYDDRYSMNLFPNLEYPTEKIKEITEWAKDTPFESIAAELNSMLVRQVRNAFFHSDYALTSTAINLQNGKFVEINGVRQESIPFDWLQPKVNAAISIARHVVDKTIASMRSYKEEKTIRGRFAANGDWMDLRLIVDPEHGLVGFRSP